jgi:hypothetical protein
MQVLRAGGRTGEVALSFALLVGSGLMVRTVTLTIKSAPLRASSLLKLNQFFQSHTDWVSAPSDVSSTCRRPSSCET